MVEHELVQPAEARTPAQRARRAELLNVAVRLLDERGYEQIQIREVAEKTGVALATLYRYFPSKELLYAHALLSWGDTFEGRVRALDKAAASDAERLRAVLHRAVRAYTRHPNFYKLVLLLEVSTDPAVRAVFDEYGSRLPRIIAEILTDTDDRDAPTVGLIAGSVVATLLRRWSVGEMSLDAVLDALDRMTELIFTKPRVRSGGGVPT